MSIILKVILSIVGVLLTFLGAVWFLQGINILPGSIMTGQIQWAIYGALGVILGVSLIVFANRRRTSGPRKS